MAPPSSTGSSERSNGVAGWAEGTDRRTLRATDWHWSRGACTSRRFQRTRGAPQWRGVRRSGAGCAEVARGGPQRTRVAAPEARPARGRNGVPGKSRRAPARGRCGARPVFRLDGWASWGRLRDGHSSNSCAGIISTVSATLLARGLAAAYGDKALFGGLDLVVAPGDVVGLVGVNGAGKSTLLRLLAGLDTPEEGKVSLSPPDGTVGYLPQEVERPVGETVAEHVARRTGVAAAERAMDAARRSSGRRPERCGRAVLCRAGALAGTGWP